MNSSHVVLNCMDSKPVTRIDKIKTSWACVKTHVTDRKVGEGFPFKELF